MQYHLDLETMRSELEFITPSCYADTDCMSIAKRQQRSRSCIIDQFIYDSHTNCSLARQSEP